MESKLIVMLTHNDQTVPNAIEIFEACKDLPVQCWGFKDVGLPPGKMEELISKMKEAGKETFLEIVSYSEEDCMKGAKLSVEYGFDYLMGTLFYESVWDYLKEENIKYMPFVGNVHSSPSILEGSVEDIIREGRKLSNDGVFGFDILAYRHKDHPEKLASEFVKAMNIPVVIAGSIGNHERIAKMKEFNPWGFTMGSALFTKNFVKEGTFSENLEEVIKIMEAL